MERLAESERGRSLLLQAKGSIVCSLAGSFPAALPTEAGMDKVVQRKEKTQQLKSI